MRAVGRASGGRAWLRPAGIALVLIILILLVRRQEGTLRIAPPGALPDQGDTIQLEQESVPASVDTTPIAGAAGRAPAATTASLRIFTSAGSYDEAAATELAPGLEDALTYVQERTGMRLARPMNIVFDRRPEACGLDAVAYTGARTAILYTCPDTPDRRATNILAHEFIHQLAHDHYGERHLRADLLLSEGLATWGAGRYWLGSHDSFHDFVAAEYRGSLLPLATDPRGGATIATLNQIYYQWASYVEWLRASHGPEAIDRLYITGQDRRPGSADYHGVLGMEFATTEEQWRAWLDQPASGE